MIFPTPAAGRAFNRPLTPFTLMTNKFLAPVLSAPNKLKNIINKKIKKNQKTRNNDKYKRYTIDDGTIRET